MLPPRPLAGDTADQFHRIHADAIAHLEHIGRTAPDPERLQPVIQALRTPLGRSALSQPPPPDVQRVLQQVVAVDGTFLPAMADVAWAVCSRNQREGQRHRARLDWQIDRRLSLRAILRHDETDQQPTLSGAPPRDDVNGDLLLTYLVNPWTAL